MPVSASLSV